MGYKFSKKRCINKEFKKENTYLGKITDRNFDLSANSENLYSNFGLWNLFGIYRFFTGFRKIPNSLVPETEEPVGIVNPDSPQPSHVQNFNFPFMAVSYETSPMLNTVNCCILGSFLDSFYLATSRFLSCWENYTTSLSKQICDTIIQLDKKTPCLEKFYQGPSKKKRRNQKFPTLDC